MREHCAIAPGTAPWPGVPRGGPAPAAGGKARGRPDAIAEVISVVGHSRWLFITAGALLAADIAGGAATAAGLLGHRGPVAVGTVGLLLPVALSWLVAAGLLLWAERPVADAVGELRWLTGAPTDLSAPWPSLGVSQLPAPGLEWPDMGRLIGAIALRQGRARLALCAAIFTTAGFLAWMVLSLTIAAS